MELVCIDYLKLETTKGEHEDVLVITDHFTRYAHTNKSGRICPKAITVKQLAYRKAVEEAGKRAEAHKLYYDQGVQENKLQEGNCVLIKKVTFEWRHIFADVWEEEPQVVLRQPNPEIPAFDMRQIDGRGRVKSLHHNEPHSSAVKEQYGLWLRY